MVSIVKTGAAVVLMGTYFTKTENVPVILRPAFVNIKLTLNKVIAVVKNFDLSDIGIDI